MRFKIILFGVGAAALAVFLLALASAWLFTFFLTHPGCHEPTPIADVPTPQTVWLDSSGGSRVRAWYYTGQNGAAVLALGGMDGALGMRQPPVGFLIRAGYSVLQIDTRACAGPGAPVTLGALEPRTPPPVSSS